MENSFMEYFNNIKDFRQQGKIKHKLIDILFIAIAATLAKCNSYEEISIFAEVKEKWFRKYLELPNGIPSHDTIQRVFENLDISSFSQCFISWTREIADTSNQPIIAIDGKTVRGSYDKELDRKAIHLVNAWIDSNKIYRKQTLEKGHGRIEKRTYYMTNDINWMEEKSKWKKLRSIGMVISDITRGEKKTRDIRYYITSLENDIEAFAKGVRKHWGVESTHWLLDVVFKEDNSRVRKNNGATNQSQLKKIALNIMKLETISRKKMALTKKRFRAGIDEGFLEQVMETIQVARQEN